MARIKSISTVNIKPAGVTALNLKPVAVATIEYGAYQGPNDNNFYGTFLYNESTYGMGTEYSVGSVMPKISTMEV